MAIANWKHVTKSATPDHSLLAFCHWLRQHTFDTVEWLLKIYRRDV